MPRQLAILAFTLFLIWLWRKDAQHRPPFSNALWIPFIWLTIQFSRPLSWWAWFFFGIGGGSSDIEGNSIDRFFYSAFIIVAILIVTRRGVKWSSVIRAAPGLSLFYGYLLLTVFWAEYPIPTIKRWVKEVGVIPVLLLILTERQPIEAVKPIFSQKFKYPEPKMGSTALRRTASHISVLLVRVGLRPKRRSKGAEI